MKTGVGFFGLLTIVFIVLKQTGYIDWSWWMVFMPLFVQAGLLIFLVIAILAIEGLGTNSRYGRRRR